MHYPLAVLPRAVAQCKWFLIMVHSAPSMDADICPTGLVLWGSPATHSIPGQCKFFPLIPCVWNEKRVYFRTRECLFIDKHVLAFVFLSRGSFFSDHWSEVMSAKTETSFKISSRYTMPTKTTQPTANPYLAMGIYGNFSVSKDP